MSKSTLFKNVNSPDTQLLARFHEFLPFDINATSYLIQIINLKKKPIVEELDTCIKTYQVERYFYDNIFSNVECIDLKDLKSLKNL